VPKPCKPRLNGARSPPETITVLAAAVRESATEDVDLDDPHGTPPVYAPYHKRHNTHVQWMYSWSQQEAVNLQVREFVLA
jgi:hypothetical protein